MGDFFKLETWYDMIVQFAPKVLLAILTLIIGFWVVGLVVKAFKRMLRKRNTEESLISFLGSFVGVILKVVVLISIAGIFGVETASFIAVLGALAFAVGMALQGTLGHFASGVLVLIFKYYKVGDFVQVNGVDGTVKDIQIFNTTLTALDNRLIIVPNGLVTGNNIINYTALGIRRIDMTFGIGYSDDIDKARSVLEQVVASCDAVLQDQQNDILVKELADSSVNFAVRLWVKAEDYWPTYFEVHEKVKKSFDKEGVSIPFPQMDLHVDNVN